MDPPPPDTSQQSTLSPMEAPIPTDPSASSALWDWSDLLDFSLDDQLNISLDSDNSPPEPEPDPDLTQILPNPEVPSKVRKRDPRLICSNFMAGRIPCACPELDAKLDEEGLPGKKRARTARAPAGKARCQVPGCEADISELKGYHKRHRVCLRCANASAVVLDGQRKRYCQQCGKFHILSDFDEGKRSCRRKLERHNNRRRRKTSESRVADERESQGLALVDDVVCDDENEKDSTSLSSQPAEREPLLESEEGQISTHCSNLISQNVSFMASGEAQIDGEKDESKYARSLVYPDNKSAYSSVCPTGRISFKLYDWNPAEFPRRLRHQIFQWLASMPVELEGYIRPGCTILTVFIAMPNFMWSKLLQDPIAYIWDFVAVPGKMLAGRGTAVVYLDNLIFRVVKDVNSVMQVKVEEQAPKLHYVHPTCFEAGKPMEFVACGSNLLQPKFRFLVSFAGKYLAYDYSIPSISSDSEGVTTSFDHQLLKIYIPRTEPDLFGPAFIEVENASGLSNFIPILIGDEGICSEMKVMENRFEASLGLKGLKSTADSSLSDSCEVSIVRQKAFSQFILDTAWLLRKPALEDTKYMLTPSQIRRFNGFMAFLMHNNSISILERVIHYIEIVMDNMKSNCVANGVPDAELKLLRSNLDNARGILSERLQDNAGLVQLPRSLVPKGDCLYQSSQIDMASVVSLIDQEAFIGLEQEAQRKLWGRLHFNDLFVSVVSLIDQDMETTRGGNSQDHSGTIPLLNQDVVMSVKLKEMPRKSCGRLFTNKYLTSRPLAFVIAATAVCFAICVVVLHPQQVGKIATTIRRCMVDKT